MHHLDNFLNYYLFPCPQQLLAGYVSCIPSEFSVLTVVTSVCNARTHRLGLDEAELDSDESSGIEDENGVESAASRSSGGGSPDSMHGSGDGPGPSGLQNVGCSSQEMLRDNNPHGGDYSNTSSPEPGDGEDLPILLPAKTERETDEVEDKSERMDVEVRAEIETEEIKRPEIVVEEKVGSDGRASAENNSGENGEEESKRSSPSVQEQENGTEVSEERERTSPSVQQQENGTEVSEERERTSQEQSSEQAAKQEIELEVSYNCVGLNCHHFCYCGLAHPSCTHSPLTWTITVQWRSLSWPVLNG